jgi:hypothetical protein
MLPHPRIRRRSAVWLALVVPILLILTSGPALADADTTPTNTSPTPPQNLRATYVDGAFDGITWDAPAVDEGGIWYEVVLWGGRPAPIFIVWSPRFTSFRELVESAYLDLGRTYTFTIVAVRVDDRSQLRRSGHSNQLTVRLPWGQTW